MSINHVIQHGVFLKLFNYGVMLMGKSGSGKSELALALLARGHQLIADDAPEFLRSGDKIIGQCPSLLRNKLALRNLGIIEVTHHFDSHAWIPTYPLHLIIQLSTDKILLNNTEPALTEKKILGINIPCLTIENCQQRQLILLAECAVRCLFQTRQLKYKKPDKIT